MVEELHNSFLLCISKCNAPEIYAFLKKRPIENIMKIRNSDGWTVLHVLGQNNRVNTAEFLIRYSKETYGDQFTEEIQTWVNEKAYDDDLTCTHMAILRGSLDLVKLFISYGAKIETPTKSGLTAMHLAAKNDQILILAWLRNNGMDSNVVDKKNFTPLHYSCLFSSELATAVLLSWKVKVNPINDDGRTPLHLGVTSGSQRIIRSLLLRGADVHIKDVCNKTPLELAIEKGNPEIVNLISTPGLLSMCGIKPPQRPIKFKSILMISYAFLLITCLISMILVLDIQDDYYYIIFTLKIILFVFVVSKNPGYLKKNHEHQLLELAQNVEYFQICPECVTKRPPRSRHCQSCNKCVEKFDHHCPWINNCIGARNLGIFYCFLITTFVIILYSIFNCSYYILSNSFSLASVVAIFWALVGVGFLIPLFLLISVQTRNFLTNTTTNERYSRKIESSTVERSDSDEQVDRNNMFDNVIQMCCNTKNQQYKSRPNNQTENNQRYSFITGEFDLSNPLLKS